MEPTGLAGGGVPASAPGPTPTGAREVGIRPVERMGRDNAARVGLVARLGKGRVGQVAFSPDGRWLAVGSSVGVYVYEAATLREARRFETDAPAPVVAFSPDGRLLASGSGDKTVIVWDVGTGERVRTLEGHTDWVHSVAFSPDGRLLASGSLDQTVIVWDVRTGERVRTLKGHTNTVWSVAFSPDGRLLASGSGDQTVIVWDVRTGERVRTLTGHTDLGVQRGLFSGWAVVGLGVLG
jgi:WD40 repeat protein